MHVRSLELHDFRSWQDVSFDLIPGITLFSGPNGNGKTNIVEALGYLADLQSHRISNDKALIRENTDQAHILATALNNGRELTTQLFIPSQGKNRAWINRTQLKSPREILGIIHTTLFAPEDLSLIRGEPELRRAFVDSIVVSTWPRMSGIKSDYERVLKQRNSLLKNMMTSRGRVKNSLLGDDTVTLDIWTEKLAFLGGQIIAARVVVLQELLPYLQEMYSVIAPDSRPAYFGYNSTIHDALIGEGINVRDSLHVPGDSTIDAQKAADLLLAELNNRRSEEINRGRTLIGPHRDDVLFMLGTQPTKGYASHGESWSYALALRLATHMRTKDKGTEPIIILDDVFAELDAKRRKHLVNIAHNAEQVLITAAVHEDIPENLRTQATIFEIKAENTDKGRISQVINKGGNADG